MNNTEPKKKGRPVGSVSFVNKSVSELLAAYGPDATLPVSRVWLEKASQPAKTVAEPAAESVSPASDVVPMTLEA